MTNFSMQSVLTFGRTVLSGHSRIDKTKILLTNSSLMKVESIAECSPWHIVTISLEKQFFAFFFVWQLKRGFTVLCIHAQRHSAVLKSVNSSRNRPPVNTNMSV